MKSSADEKVYHRIHSMIGSMEKDTRIDRGGINEARETLGWEMIRVQVDSAAVDAVGPKEVVRAFEMKETAMSRRGNGFVAASGRGIKNKGEKTQSSARRKAKELV